jgi:drug/metabolite transporter superfamily protein YnfA
MAYDVDRRPGAWVAKQAARRSARVWFLAGVLAALALIAIGLLVSNRATIARSAVFIVLALALKRYADGQVDPAIRWLGGARAETSVGEELNDLQGEGFVVMHDIEQRCEGNVDHLVSGPTGVFMVETKERRYEDHHLAKAKRQAARIHDELGVWVTPVICIHRRRGHPFKTQSVWIVPQPCLLGWIREQCNTPIDFERLARWADGL